MTLGNLKQLKDGLKMKTVCRKNVIQNLVWTNLFKDVESKVEDFFIVSPTFAEKF